MCLSRKRISDDNASSLATGSSSFADEGFPVNRRKFLASSIAAAILIQSELTPSAHAQLTDPLQDWLRTNAIPIGTVDAHDEEFGDLEPLATLIGDARVVQLGEPSHNAGTCFSAKARLVKFLHQRMGFDVVVWESGFYDVERSEAALGAGEDAVTSARLAILENWSASEECRPLFEYAKASHSGKRPLVMAGFDMTATGDFAVLADELRSFVSTLSDVELRRIASAATEEVIQSFGALNAYVQAFSTINAMLIGTTGYARTEAMTTWERDVGDRLRPGAGSLERLQPAVERLIGLFNIESAAFAEIEGDQRSGFWKRVVANLGGRGANLYERFGVDVPATEYAAVVQENRRDALNAENLRWLIEKGYPNHKLIIWAHNAHVMNAYYEAPDFKTISLDPVPNSMKPHGVHLAEWLGNDLYTIGLTVYEGDDGWTGLQSVPVPPASDGSLEARLHQLGARYAFLDLRSARGIVHHLLRAPLTMRVPKYDEVEIDPAGPYDALFFIDRTDPATLVR